MIAARASRARAQPAPEPRGLRTLRVGLVGCGRLAERGYVPALKLAQGITLAALADPVLSRCDTVAPGVPAYTSAAALLAAAEVDAVVLATPAAAHLAEARQKSTSPLIRDLAATHTSGFGFGSSSQEVESRTLAALHA